MKHNKKVSVGILGATGTVGQRFIQLLSNHPWFEISAIAASDQSAGNLYKDVTKWNLSDPFPKQIGNMSVQSCKPILNCDIVFSALDSTVAGKIETEFANAGYIVFSNAKNHRMDTHVPLLVPEVNSKHISLINQQKFSNGKIITNPNCSTIGLVLPLAPLVTDFCIDKINVVTMQAISGAGYPGISSMDIVDNIIPFIDGEEDKIESEPKKIFGYYNGSTIDHKLLNISATCTRVPVIDGHVESVSIKFKQKPRKQDILTSWERYRSVPQELKLPSAPKQPIYYFHEDNFPQPKLHRSLENGMAVSVGRLRDCSIFDYKFIILSHNTIRGAAGGAILNAELFMKTKNIK